MRLFLALNLDDALRRQIHGDLDPVRVAAPEIRWTRPEQLHITLRFFGEVPDDQVASLTARFRDVARRHRSLSVDLTGLGAFPHWRRPRVVWLGVRDPVRAGAVARDLETASVALGFGAEERPFRAHLTIGRVTRPLLPGRAPVLERAARAFAGTYQTEVRSVDLMQSQLAPGGSIYSVVESFPLEAE